MSDKVKRKQYNLDLRRRFVEHLTGGKKNCSRYVKSLRQTAKDLGVNPPAPATVSGWVKAFKTGKLLTEETSIGRKMIRNSTRLQKYPKVNQYILDYIRERQQQQHFSGFSTSGVTIQQRAQEKARQLAAEGFEEYRDFRASPGWLHKFCARNNINLRQLNGKSPACNSIDETEAQISDFRSHLTQTMCTYDVPLERVYNMDEFTLFYSAFPNALHVIESKTRDPTDFKQMISQNCVTGLVCVNATGDHKLPIALVGKTERPPCLEIVPPVLCPYNFSKKAQMTKELYLSWWLPFFKKEVIRRHGSTNVILIWGNVPNYLDACDIYDEQIHLCTTNTRALSLRLPCEQGIIAELKIKYRTQMLVRVDTIIAGCETYEKLLANLSMPGNYEPGCGCVPNFVDATELLSTAWALISAQSIQNCWRTSHCLTIEEDVQSHRLEEETDYIEQMITAIKSLAARANSIGMQNSVLNSLIGCNIEDEQLPSLLQRWITIEEDDDIRNILSHDDDMGVDVDGSISMSQQHTITDIIAALQVIKDAEDRGQLPHPLTGVHDNLLSLSGRRDTQ
eukprot:gene9210-1496_t